MGALAPLSLPQKKPLAQAKGFFVNISVRQNLLEGTPPAVQSGFAR